MSATSAAPLRVWVFGRAPQCDIVVDHADVAERHCLIAQYQEGYALEDLGTASGTRVNGKQLQPRQPEWVTASDVITLGAARLPWPAQSTAPAPPGGGRAWTGPRVIAIGRAPESDVVLDYPMISWNHARLTRDAQGRLTLEDLGSTNGTSLGRVGNRIQRTEVGLHDSVFFGSFKIPVARLLEGKLVLGDADQETVRLTGTSMVIGRDPLSRLSPDLPRDLVASRRARKAPRAESKSRTSASRNGTFVDGVRITARALLQARERDRAGQLPFRLLDDGRNTRQTRDYQGNVTVRPVAGRGGDPRRGGEPPPARPGLAHGLPVRTGRADGSRQAPGRRRSSRH